MRHRVLTILTTAMLTGGLTATAQTATGRFAAGAGGEGAVYHLPRTNIRVDVLVEKTSYRPGRFCRYAERYLRLHNVEQDEQTTWRVLQIKQTVMAEPDTAKAYQLRFSPNSATANLRLSDSGLLLAINDQPLSMPQQKPFKAAKRQPTPDAQQYLSQDILLAGSTAKMAELTAEEIFDVRENKALLVKGQADFMPKDGRQLELMLEELDRENQALTALFSGITEHDTTQVSFVISPQRPIARQVLFRFSEKLGVVDNDDLGGRPFYITVSDITQQPKATPQQLARAKKQRPVENGVYVNVPGQMRSIIEDGIQPVDQQTLPAPQFGSVELLSGALFNKKFTTRLRLNPITGAIDRLQAEQPQQNKK